MAIPDPDTILAHISYDGLAAAVLAGVAVGFSDGKLTTNELGEITATIQQMVGGRLGYDEVWTLVNASWTYVSQHGTDAGVARASTQLWADPVVGGTVISLAAAVAQKSGGIGNAEGLAIRKLASYVGVQPDSNEYFQLLAAGQQLGKT